VQPTSVSRPTLTLLTRYAIIALAFYIYPDNVQSEPTGNGLIQRFFATS
jgi:hypothetical protein